MISTGKIWFSAVGAYNEYLKLAAEIGTEAVEQEAQYKQVLEARLVAILCLALYGHRGTAWFLQLQKNDPPDALIMRQSPSHPGTHELLGVEVTSYFKNKSGMPKDDIFEQLKKTKMFEKYHKYSEHDVILVDLGSGYQPDYAEIQNYMKSINAPYQVWFLQEVQPYPDTIAQLTLCNRERVFQRQINVGEAMAVMKEKGVPGVIRTERVGALGEVGKKMTAHIDGAPWDEENLG